MKISVVFPGVVYREGPEGVQKLIRGIEDIGFDELVMFDHVVMGYPTDERPAPFYPPKMPILEAFMLLSYAAAITSKIELGTGVLVLPQRQPTLVAKQIQSLDMLSGGRVRLGVGIGWQESEFDALQENFRTRARRFEEAIQLLRTCWAAEHVNFDGEFYQLDEIAMEPKSPQGANIPILIGGSVPATLRRVGELGDGWIGQFVKNADVAAKLIERIRWHAEEAGRDPDALEMQLSLSPFHEEDGKGFYSDLDRMHQRYVELRDLGFHRTSINAITLFQGGHRTVESLIERLAEIHEKLKAEQP